MVCNETLTTNRWCDSMVSREIDKSSHTLRSHPRRSLFPSRVMAAVATVLLLAAALGSVSAQDDRPLEESTEWPSWKRQKEWTMPNSGVQSWDSVPFFTEPTYFIVASRMVRPGHIYRISVTLLQYFFPPLTVRASIQRNGVEITVDSKEVKEGSPETLMLRIPPTSGPGTYKLRVEGIYDEVMNAIAFVNETYITFSKRSMTIFIQTDKPVYMQGQTVKFRAIPINTELKAFDDAVDVFMLDPRGIIMRRWLSRQSNLGTVSLDYQLSDQPVFGRWTIQVKAQYQTEEATFLVEEYYQTRFEVNVTMPAFFFTTDPYIHGTVMANYTSGAPVKGNLTLKATIRPINQKYNNNKNNRLERQEVVVKYFNFDEEYPSWFTTFQNKDPEHDNYRNYESERIPHMKFFHGTYQFRYPLSELENIVPSLDGVEVKITATVGEHFMDEIVEGYSIARIYNSSIKVSFMGGSPQVFKPQMPFSCYLAVSYHDGSHLSREHLELGQMEVQLSVTMQSGGRTSLQSRELRMYGDKDAVWELKIDLDTELGLTENKRSRAVLNDITEMRITAYFKDYDGQRSTADLLLLSHYSPGNHQIKVSTSTRDATVGEYAIFHVQSNFYLDMFQFLVMSKGIVLLTGQQKMKQSVATFAVALSAEMAPVATVVVYHFGLNGVVVADSLTFPVDGISRNNFTVFINNRKARTGEKVEVAIYGEPGTYVGLSGIDRAFFTMQAGNELTYSQVLSKMSKFDEQTNGTFVNTWLSHGGDPDELVYFPSSTYGIDANRTFEYVGLMVFSDAEVPTRPSFCNATQGLLECLNGRRCFPIQKKCDGMLDCEDGTDEANCDYRDYEDLTEFRKFRFNRIQRQYENVWLWRDINIGPHGRYLFTEEVPARPAHWMISVFSMSPTYGFGMLSKPLEYVGVLPFFINVEMPTLSRQGEQIGIRVTVFNYMTSAIEATVALAGSKDYKFVHVEMNGIVSPYNPRTSFREHQFFVYIPAQDAAIVHIPIVPTRLGDIDVTVLASTLIGRDIVTRRLHVEADGLPQLRHQSILLDLSNRAYVFQYLHVNVTETPLIPYQQERYYVYGSNKAFVSIVGDVVGPIFPTMPVNATSILNLPMDCAEQTMFSFASILYTTMYMRLINQRNRTLEKWAFHHMNILYQRQLSYLKPDGSFSIFRSDWNQSSSSVWLTAWCARVFQEASFYEWENYIYIDPKVLEGAMSYILEHQNPEGSFYEVTWLPDRKMNDSLVWPDDTLPSRNISLTAHVLITLATVKDLPGGLGARVALAQSKAIDWLERNVYLLQILGEPYEVAIVSYALLLARSSAAESAFNILTKHARNDGGYIYWGKEKVPDPPYKMENQKPFLLPRLPYKYDSSNIETTAYALLTYVSRQELFIDPIVKWLNAQRLTDGGWASTQDTAIAMKALIEYTVRSRLRDVSDLTVTIEATALKNQTKPLRVNDNNWANLQKIEIPEAWGTVKVQAKGAGYAILQMSVQYNVDNVEYQTEPPVRAFHLVTRANFHGRNHSHVTYTSCQSWTNLNESERSGMAVLDVTIPTGYIIQQQKLDAYILSRRVRNLQRARFQESKVLFYFDYLDQEDICLNFTVERWHPVANMSRYLPIRVYDYYAPERFNETIFDSLPTYILNICEVCGSSQCPYCPIYNLATALPVPVSVLLVTSIVLLIRHFRYSVL